MPLKLLSKVFKVCDISELLPNSTFHWERYKEKCMKGNAIKKNVHIGYIQVKHLRSQLSVFKNKSHVVVNT